LNLAFHKFEGTGNDFILIDNREYAFKNDASRISGLCDRKFGIGADGLILLEASGNFDFSMRYFNADGLEVDMCGNGGRCIVAFARYLGIAGEKCTFQARDGIHQGEVIQVNGKITQVRISLLDVENVSRLNKDYIINTGVPHYVRFVDDTGLVDVLEEGRKIRYAEQFKNGGINVDFVHFENGKLVVRTYERGVENETLSCGTGVTAASIAAFYEGLANSPVDVMTRGGELRVEFLPSPDIMKNILLSGPATLVFKGEIYLKV
jgi:diaminopimelate epimerase